MVKGFVTAIVTIAATVGMVGLVQTVGVAAKKDDTPKPEKVTICHRTNAVNNPYRQIKVAQSAVDGVAGNSGKKPDHFGEHQGPIATSEEVAQALKDSKTKWGDIIPPVEGFHEGYNWTAEGQAMWENGCKFVEEEKTTSFEASLVCVDEKYTLTVTNTGETTLDVEVNGTSSDVVMNDELTADFNVGDSLTVKVNDDFVTIEGKELNDYLLKTCKGGGKTTTTTTTDTTGEGEVASLPVTSGASDQIAAIVVMVGSMLATAGGYALRARAGLSL